MKQTSSFLESTMHTERVLMADAHVLVVDDKPELQELVRYNLSKAG